MLSKEMLKVMFNEGRELSDKDYIKHCRTNHAKTFYFFCLELSSGAPNKSLSSTELNERIFDHLRHRGIDVKPHFNPQGWFGQAWTDWNDSSKNERYFRNEYCEVLIRAGEDPYSYQIRPEYFRTVKEILHEAQSANQQE